MGASENRNRAPATLALIASCCFGVTSCNLTENVCFLESPESAYQLAPSARAVAFVNPAEYGRILDGSAGLKPRMDCVVEEFTRLFENQPDSIVIVLDLEDWMVTRSRLFLEHGIDQFQFIFEDTSGLSEDERRVRAERWIEVSDAVREAMSGVPFPPTAAYNGVLRIPDAGVGSKWLDLFPSGPPTLRGHVLLPTREDLVSGRFLHEFCHNWAAYLDGPPVLTAQIDTFGSHWGYTSVGGLLGGWEPGSLASVGDGLYRVRAFPAGRAINKWPYAPLELYLMGLAGPAEVPAIQVAVNVEHRDRTDDYEDVFSASAIETVTIEQILAANGPRVPGVEDAPKRFKLALIILSDHELSDAEWDF